MIRFFHKILQILLFQLLTLSGQALDDVYVTVHFQVKDMLREGGEYVVNVVISSVCR